MELKVMLDKWGMAPTRGHKTDAGLDIYSPVDIILEPHSQVVINSGVHIEMPSDNSYVCFAKSRSSLMRDCSITTDGTIDQGYTGSIGVCLFNHGDSEVNIKKGDRIAQLVIVPCITPKVVIVDSLSKTDRSDKGFGSTGK